MSRYKTFIIETLDFQGMLLSRVPQDIEDNPEYGEVECKKILSNHPEVASVSLMRQQYNGDTPLFMTDDEGNTLTDGNGTPRPLCRVVMKFDRKLDRQTFERTLWDWEIE